MSVYTYTARTFTHVATLPHTQQHFHFDRDMKTLFHFDLDMKTLIISSTIRAFHSSIPFHLIQTSLKFLVKL